MGNSRTTFLFLTVVIGFLIIFFLTASRKSNVSLVEVVSREVAVEIIKKECRGGNYQDLALQSLKRVNGGYRLVTEEDLNDSDPLKNYLQKAKGLCNLLLSDYTLEVTKNSGTYWTYRFTIKPFPMGNSQAYGLVHLEGSWRFVLPESARL